MGSPEPAVSNNGNGYWKRASRYLDSMTLKIQGFQVHSALCTESVLGMHFVLKDFGLFSVLSAFEQRLSAKPADFEDIVRAFLEYSIGQVYGLPFEAVAVASWKAGTLAVDVGLETNSRNWNAAAKATLRDFVQKQYAALSTTIALFAKAGATMRAKNLPVRCGKTKNY